MKVVTPSGFFYFLSAISLAAAVPANSAAQQQVVVAPPPPAPVMETRSPGPPPMVESPRDSAARIRAMQEPVTLEVEVTGRGERIWLGSLRVSSLQSGEYSSTLSQPRLPCPGIEFERGYGSTLQNRLTVSFQRRETNRDIDSFFVRIGWTYPRETCDGGGGQSSVGFDLGFILRPGETKLLNGEGGLVLKVTRRR